MIRLIELFAGIGACSKALENLNIQHEIVDAVEIDKYAITSFNAIHGTNFEPQDITKWDKDFEDIDLIMHGSPCQDYSVAGKQAGGDKGSGTRSSLMYESIRIIEKIKPKYVVWENVKNLLSKKHKHNFDAYLETMSMLGYNNYYKVLNAKDYGIPQNRVRIFTISIRKDIDSNNFKFPEKQELTLKLKDMLDDVVDDKYYLNDEIVSNYIPVNEGGNVIGKLNMNKWQDNMKRIYNINKYAPTINTMQGGNLEPKILTTEIKDIAPTQTANSGCTTSSSTNLINESVKLPCICASRGRYNTNSDIFNSSTKQNLEINTKGITNTITSVQKDNLVLELENKDTPSNTNLDNIKVIGNYMPCEHDATNIGINIIEIPQTVRVRKYPIDTEKLRKVLRIHKILTNKEIALALNKPITLVEHWFRADSCFSIPDSDIWFKLKDLLNIDTNEFDEPIMTFEEKEGVYEKANRCCLDDGVSPTLTSLSGSEKVITNLRIRKLTPLECWRLMGFNDNDFNVAKKALNDTFYKSKDKSNSQLYKQAGNSIVVNVLLEIFKNLFNKEVIL